MAVFRSLHIEKRQNAQTPIKQAQKTCFSLYKNFIDSFEFEGISTGFKPSE
tara:strand:- start:293 stop:445 length:153 start_codon:yes stop_codon:yes gene_type:complete